MTGNKEKFKEASSILEAYGVCLEQVSLDIREVQEIDVEVVTKKKAEEAVKRLRKPVIVEDTALYLRALNGFPGALIDWMLKSIGNNGIIRIVNEFKERKAMAVTCVAFCKPGKKPVTFVGEINGKIAKKAKGKGFGWDPIFIPTGHKRTFGEMSKKEKNKISMRRIALEKFAKWFLRAR
ncbi:MAG: RdgB/HAM1 family non-canonical purine NTP pyrophosphatase [Candidatus Parvarchaeota archaeon]|nr:RdgB/HAM1 family non-canonical purine NTP pyrophosphatase [Candidatus Jingweiarchaeum tengchongense]MCW1297706.1 RdgB/HAM1 family non-canonical purine NTP pyrophosphatase [Candidatus Jingweiarchaeum tengchongense]MCW1299717.1 RdgB/HAM1 family non-canonical purine NTP pyrophosphatase [Candidatus Jingweiarchaeum tengchongense]MCW1304315.1 RdgB/HAM1 family non-canonical purine NTP pyrophosphatase [Candidatus Jingweiarchaeum tengchongense]MCW1305702.1 RdgB/HAM1 family non-canonical purine NTP py